MRRGDEMDDMTVCNKAREAIAADPDRPAGGDVATHEAGCARCRAYRAEMQALDRSLKHAMALAVPELRLPELPEVDSGSVTSIRRPAAPFT